MHIPKVLPLLPLICALSLPPLSCRGESAPLPRLGTNLTAPDDWNTELPFVDVFKLARKWISQSAGKEWGRGPALDLDEHGWVKSLEPGAWVETPFLSVSGRCPAGEYTLLYDGEGKITLQGSNAARVEILDESPGRIVFLLTPEPMEGDGSIFLAIRETDPGNYIRNIRILMPGHAETYDKDPFRPGFLEMWKGMAAFRFMDWMKTNNSKISKWSERPTLESATWTGQGGVPLEIMIDLANRQKADPWFCMPHRADDEYVRNFAQMVKEKLDPSLKVYVEYSNEVWNSMFDQHKWAGEQGLAASLAKQPWEAAWKFYARRSVQIFKIWEEVFGGTDRLVRVLSSQASNPHVARQILAFEEAGQNADALGIAPYINFNIPAKSDNPASLLADEVASWTVEQVMQEISTNRLDAAIRNMMANKEVADKYGLKLVGYEGGQHAVGIQRGENNANLTSLLHQANRTPQMGEVYSKYFEGWVQAGGDLMVQFSSIGRWSKWGSWGLMEYYNSNPEDYPKFQATMRWAKSLGQPVNAP